jgi:hypothetical protein
MVDCLEIEIGVFEEAATDRMRANSGIEPVDLTTPVTPRRPATGRPSPIVQYDCLPTVYGAV